MTMAALDDHLRQMLAMVRDVFEGEPAYAYYGFYGQLEWYHRQGWDA